MEPADQNTTTTPEKPKAGYLSVEQMLENAPADCIEEDVEGVFGGKVRVRGLTAAQQAQVKQVSLTFSGRGADIVWGEMERTQFRLGLIDPKVNMDQARTMHLQSGASFAKIIAKIDELSGTSEEERKKAQAAFQGPDE